MTTYDPPTLDKSSYGGQAMNEQSPLRLAVINNEE